MDKKRKIRVRGGFSDRNMIEPISKEMQYKVFSQGTRIVLFNSLKNNVEKQISIQHLNRESVAKVIVESLFNDIYYAYSDSYSSVLDDIRLAILNEEYHTVLTIIEYMCNLVFESMNHFLERHGQNWFYANQYIDIREQMNLTFEDEFIGYRFVGEKIVPITNEAEIDSLNGSLKTPYEKVNESISKSILFISETGKKDYKNSIKECVTALEQMINILNGSEGLVLSNALEQLCNKISINDNLKESIKKIYKYASDTNGVRHGNNKDNDNVTFEEAKLVLLLCSASINYLCSLKID